MSEGLLENVKGPLLSHRPMNGTPSDLSEATILSLTPQERQNTAAHYVPYHFSDSFIFS